MTNPPRNISQALSTFENLWSPRTLATVNDCEVRLAKVRGDYVWHRHPDSDEMFVVVEGRLRIDLRPEGPDAEHHDLHGVDLGVGDTFVVPRGVEHRPSSPDGASIVVVDRVGTLTTGDFDGPVPEHITATAAGLPLE